MKKSNVILLRITAILSITISVFFLFECIGLLFNLFGFKDVYIEMMKSMGVKDNQISAQVYMGVFDGLIGLFLNSYCAGIYYRVSRAKGIPIGGAKTILYMGVLQCLFIISILPGIFAIIIGNRFAKEERNIIDRPREEANGLEDIAYQIAELKKQKEKGEITQMQYDRALNAIIERSAKQQINNPISTDNLNNDNKNDKE